MKKCFFILFVVFLISCQKETTTTVTYWTENIGSDKTVPLLPDSNVNYFLYSFKRIKGSAVGIRIRGQYGIARYMSYNIYDNNTLSSVGSIVDTKIIPDAGSENRYLPSTGTSLVGRNYTINICPSTVDSTLYINTLRYDDRIENVGIILRYYIPQQNNYANVPLPTIEAFDINTGAALPTPLPAITNFKQQFQAKYQQISTLLNLAGILEAPKDIYFYRFSGAFLYPNLDNY